MTGVKFYVQYSMVRGKYQNNRLCPEQEQNSTHIYKSYKHERMYMKPSVQSAATAVNFSI